MRDDLHTEPAHPCPVVSLWLRACPWCTSGGYCFGWVVGQSCFPAPPQAAYGGDLDIPERTPHHHHGLAWGCTYACVCCRSESQRGDHGPASPLPPSLYPCSCLIQFASPQTVPHSLPINKRTWLEAWLTICTLPLPARHPRAAPALPASRIPLSAHSRALPNPSGAGANSERKG